MVVGWLVIGILVVIVLVVLFKSQDVIFFSALVKKYFFFVIIAAIVLFFVFSLAHIHANYDADFTSVKGIAGVGKVYVFWLKGVFVNLGDITGYAAEQDWFSSNSTESE